MKTLKVMAIVAICQMGSTFAAADMQKLAEKIVKLRGEVETLNSELQAAKSDYNSELKGAGARRTQLEAQIQQENIRNKQLNQKLNSLKNELTTSYDAKTDLRPMVLAKLKKAKEIVNNSLPFQKEKRLADLKEIENKLEGWLISPASAIGRLWAFVEDEMRLSRENAIHKQTISLEGEEKLATVVKLGMVQMYFLTMDNQAGKVVKNPQGQYDYVAIRDQQQAEKVFRLVDGIKKQIRHGRYDLPTQKL